METETEAAVETTRTIGMAETVRATADNGNR
jgi:hypothetical protein